MVDVIRWVLIALVVCPVLALAVGALMGEVGERSRPTPPSYDNAGTRAAERYANQGGDQ